MEPRYVDNIQALRQNPFLTNPDGGEPGPQTFIVGGYWQPGDGGGGTFLLHQGSIPTYWQEDHGIIIRSTHFSDVWYQRLIDTPYISVRWFGAKGTYGSNDTLAINRTFKAVRNHLLNNIQIVDSGYTYLGLNTGTENVSRTRIYFPAGSYGISSPIAEFALMNFSSLEGTSLEILGENSVLERRDDFVGGFALQISAYLNVKISSMGFYGFANALKLDKGNMMFGPNPPFVERASRVLIENCQFTFHQPNNTPPITSTAIHVNLKYSMIEMRDVTWRGYLHCVDLLEGNVTITGAWITCPPFDVAPLDANFIIHKGYLNMEHSMFIPNGGKYITQGWVDTGIPINPGSGTHTNPGGATGSGIILDNGNTVSQINRLSNPSFAYEQAWEAKDGIKGGPIKDSPTDEATNTIKVWSDGCAFVKNLGGYFRAEHVRFGGESLVWSIVFNFANGHKIDPGKPNWPLGKPIFILIKNCLTCVGGPAVTLFEVPNSVVWEDCYGFSFSSPLIAMKTNGQWANTWEQKLKAMYGYFSVKVDNIPYHGYLAGNWQTNSIPNYLLPYMRINNGLDSYGYIESSGERDKPTPQELIFFLGKKSNNQYGAFSSLYGDYSYEVVLTNVVEFPIAGDYERGNMSEQSVFRIKTLINYSNNTMVVSLEDVTLNNTPRAPKLLLDPVTNAITAWAGVDANNEPYGFGISYQIRNLIPPVVAPYEI